MNIRPATSCSDLMLGFDRDEMKHKVNEIFSGSMYRGVKTFHVTNVHAKLMTSIKLCNK